MKSLFKWMLLFAGAIGALVLIFYGIENYRGAKVWTNAKAFLESEGEALEFEKLLSPLPPVEENFCTIPLVASITDFEQTYEGEVVYRDPGQHDRIAKMRLPKTEDAVRQPDRADFKSARSPDFEGLAKLFTESDGFEILNPSAPPAERILAALARFDSEFTELAEAAKRPCAVFLFDWGDADLVRMAAMTPHLTDVNAVSKLLGVRAVAALETGNPQTARDSVGVMLRLADAVEHPPALMSYFVARTVRGYALDSIWYGLKTRTWRDEDLAFLGKDFSKLRPADSAVRAFRGDMAIMMIEGMDFMKGIGIRNATSIEAKTFLPDEDAALIALGFRLMPDGWWDRNKSEGCLFVYDEMIHPLKNRDFSRLGVPTDRFSKVTPYNFMAKLPESAYRTMARNALREEVFLKLGRTACALERHFIAHGRYPPEPNLDPLVPDFLDAVPIDPFDGKPIRYTEELDGRFRIYSIGMDGIDDVGAVLFRTGGRNRYFEEGDWAWAYSFPEREESE